MEKISVHKFIKEYNTAKEKRLEYKFQKLLARKYIPYLEKLNKMTQIVDMSCYKTVNGKKIYSRDTACLTFTFLMKMIEMYTVIDVADDVMEAYDALAESGTMNAILAIIPEREYTTCKSLMEMVQADIEYNTRDLVPFLENKLDVLNITSDTILSTLTAPETYDAITKVAKQKNIGK